MLTLKTMELACQVALAVAVAFVLQALTALQLD
jgi:hypothetical protein